MQNVLRAPEIRRLIVRIAGSDSFEESIFLHPALPWNSDSPEAALAFLLSLALSLQTAPVKGRAKRLLAD